MQAKTLSKYLDWANLNPVDRKILMAMCFDDSPEVARENLRLSRQQFYGHWRYLEDLYNTLPKKAIIKFKSYGRVQYTL